MDSDDDYDPSREFSQPNRPLRPPAPAFLDRDRMAQQRPLSEPLHRLSGSSGTQDDPVFCQVEGCTKDIRQEKEYYQRYRICEEHLKLSSLLKDGVPQRFCQQCGRFHELAEFDGDKRSCRARLSLHNNRRRKRGGAAGSGEGGRGRKQRSRQRKPPTLLQERRVARVDEADLANVPRLLPGPEAGNGLLSPIHAASSGSATAERMRQVAAQTLSLSEVAGFQAPQELANAVELLSGQSGYAYLPGGGDTPAGLPSAARMMRHSSLTEEPLAFGSSSGSRPGEPRPEELFKSASDPAHVMQGVQGLGWGELAALGHYSSPAHMRAAVERGIRMEPHMLQQYANAMPSVRIPPPVHDGGGLYNPFSSSAPFSSSTGPIGHYGGDATFGDPTGAGLQRDSQHVSQLQQQQLQQPGQQAYISKRPSLQRVSDSALPLRFNSGDSMQASADTLQRWSSSDLGRRLMSQEGPSRLNSLSSQQFEMLGGRLNSPEGLAARLGSHESAPGALGTRLSSHASSTEQQWSVGWPQGLERGISAFERPSASDRSSMEFQRISGFMRHSSTEGMPPPRAPLPRAGGSVPNPAPGTLLWPQAPGISVRRQSATEIAARMAAAERSLGPGGGAPMDAYHQTEADVARLQASGLPEAALGQQYRLPVTTGAAGTLPGGNPFSTLSEPLLVQRSRAAYAQLARESANAALAQQGQAALPPLFDEGTFAAPRARAPVQQPTTPPAGMTPRSAMTSPAPSSGPGASASPPLGPVTTSGGGTTSSRPPWAHSGVTVTTGVEPL